MSVKRVTPEEAAELANQGWLLIDVRSIPEFESGHPEGAYNVPFMHKTPIGRLAPNEQFVELMERRFAKTDKLVMACRTGNRSLKAARILQARGYHDIVDMCGGYVGETDASGALVCEGWQPLGLPTATEARPGRSFDELDQHE